MKRREFLVSSIGVGAGLGLGTTGAFAQGRPAEGLGKGSVGSAPNGNCTREAGAALQRCWDMATPSESAKRLGPPGINGSGIPTGTGDRKPQPGRTPEYGAGPADRMKP